VAVLVISPTGLGVLLGTAASVFALRFFADFDSTETTTGADMVF
jgi:hypothetical protein